MKINSRKIVSYTVTLPSTWLQMLVRTMVIVCWDSLLCGFLRANGDPRCGGDWPCRLGDEWAKRAQGVMEKVAFSPDGPR